MSSIYMRGRIFNIFERRGLLIVCIFLEKIKEDGMKEEMESCF